MTTSKILIVDDDPDLRTGLSIRLQASGYGTVFAEDAVGAISAARHEQPDMIILDLGLPGGDGYLVMERLRDLPETQHIPIVVLSARDVGGNKRRSLRSGAVAFFQKPADNDQLLETINSVLVESTVGA